MRPYDIILKKRNGLELSSAEINFMVAGFMRGEIPSYQMAAFLMAIYFKGMSAKETVELTLSLIKSGECIDISSISGIKVDKHSTGGVGDKVTLVLAPLVAAVGVPVPMISGRGLGHTGGTLDKLESIPGFRTNLSKEEFINNVRKINLAIMGQTEGIAPADGKIYALRDVTATVDSIPLIVASILSKKFAEGADALVLDVKTGSGAFMHHYEDSLFLAKALVEIGTQMGRKVVALITDMNQPLGQAIGNSLEVKEAIDALQGCGPSDLLKVVLELGAHMLKLGERVENLDEGKEMLNRVIAEGKGLTKFKEMVVAQGGKVEAIDQPDLLPCARERIPVESTLSGFVQRIDTEAIGISATLLGAGRERVDSLIDSAVGLVVKKKLSDYVEEGEPLAILHVNNKDNRVSLVKEKVRNAYTLGKDRPAPHPLIYSLVTIKGVEELAREGN